MRLEPLGEAAYLVRDLAAPAYLVAELLNANPPPGLVEAVAAYETLGLYVEPEKIDLAALEALVDSMSAPQDQAGESNSVDIPVRYDGSDLVEVCARLDLAHEDVVRMHSERVYRCFAIGFCPGFPYLGYLNDRLVLPRKDQPLTRVAARSIAIAGRQTGIYPLERPGGWWLIGTTDTELVDLRAPSFLLKAGDQVRFRPI